LLRTDITRKERKRLQKEVSLYPKGNADTERMVRTMKEELFWLREWENERELSLELDKWVQYYNRNYLHSAHEYRTPVRVEEQYYKSHDSHKNAA
jgi:transposase InsO family protein